MSPSAHLTVVGSGTLLPSADHRSAAHHLEIRGGGGVGSLLLDCGAGTLHGLAAAGVPWRAIDVVALTHYHPDHVSDLVPLLAAYRYEGRTRPLTLVGPGDLADFLGRAAGLYGSWVTEPGFPLRVEGIGPEGGWTDADGAVRVTARPTVHTEGSIALRVDGAWGALGYTGDTGPSAGLGAFLADCDLLLCECALTDPAELDTHLSPSGVAALAREARPGLLVVTHVYPPTTPAEAVEAIALEWDGAVTAARDGLRVRIPGGVVGVDPPPQDR